MVSSVDWRGLLHGELLLILTVTGGLAFGKLLLAVSLPEKVMGILLPEVGDQPRGDSSRGRIPRLHPDILFSLAVSLGSSRAGAAIVAEAYREGRLSRREGIFGTLLQSFPGYIKRWFISFPTALGLAGVAGGIYSAVVLLRSFCRFLFFLLLLRREEFPVQTNRDPCSEVLHREESAAVSSAENEESRGVRPSETGVRAGGRQRGEIALARTLARTLPLACTVYALAYILSPWLQSFLQEKGASFPLLSSAGWTVAAASFAHVNAALGVAGGAIASGTLTVAQGVLALLVGNMLAVLSRVLRQDLAFWLGIFPGRMVRSLFVWNLTTLLATMAVTVFLASIPVLWGW